MAFDFSAFFGGFAKAAGEEVEKKNKEIRDTAISEFEQLRKQAEEKNERLRTQRDKLKSTAEVLSSYRGKNNEGFTESQVVGLLQNPAVAKRVTETLDKNADSLDQIDFKELFTVSKGNTDTKVEDYIKSRTSAPMPIATDTQTKQVKTAFGLGSNAMQRAETEFAAASGKSIAQLRAEARGLPEETDKAEGVVNLGQFRDPETVARVQGRLRDNIAGGDTDLNSEKNKPLMAKLRANAIIESQFGSDKVRTTAQISSVFTQSLKAAMDPFIVKGVVRFDPAANDFVPISGDAAAIKDYMDHKNKIIEGQAKAMGLIDKNGKILGGRNAEDALIPYANIKDGVIESWKTVDVPKAPGAPAEPAPKKADAAKTSASVVVDRPLPIPKTADGKIDGTKLVLGQTYTDSEGNVQAWNGMKFQPLNK
jgi:hypothetical protein